MHVKTLNAKRTVLTLLGGAVSYAAFSFLAAVVCYFEILEIEKMGILYFAVGSLGSLFAAVMTKCFLKGKRYWAALLGLGMIAGIAFLCCGRETVAEQVWVYPGSAAGALGYIAAGAGKTNRSAQRRKKQRKK